MLIMSVDASGGVCRLLLGPCHLPGPQHADRGRVEVDDPLVTGTGLRPAAVLTRASPPLAGPRRAVADIGDLPPHDDPATGQVHVIPAQTAQLAASHPGVRGQV